MLRSGHHQRSKRLMVAATLVVFAATFTSAQANGATAPSPLLETSLEVRVAGQRVPYVATIDESVHRIDLVFGSRLIDADCKVVACARSFRVRTYLDFSKLLSTSPVTHTSNAQMTHIPTALPKLSGHLHCLMTVIEKTGVTPPAERPGVVSFVSLKTLPTVSDRQTGSCASPSPLISAEKVTLRASDNFGCGAPVHLANKRTLEISSCAFDQEIIELTKDDKILRLGRISGSKVHGLQLVDVADQASGAHFILLSSKSMFGALASAQYNPTITTST